MGSCVAKHFPSQFDCMILSLVVFVEGRDMSSQCFTSTTSCKSMSVTKSIYLHNEHLFRPSKVGKEFSLGGKWVLVMRYSTSTVFFPYFDESFFRIAHWRRCSIVRRVVSEVTTLKEIGVLLLGEWRKHWGHLLPIPIVFFPQSQIPMIFLCASPKPSTTPGGLNFLRDVMLPNIVESFLKRTI